MVFIITIRTTYSLSETDANLSFIFFHCTCSVLSNSVSNIWFELNIRNKTSRLFVPYWSNTHVKIGHCWQVRKKEEGNQHSLSAHPMSGLCHATSHLIFTGCNVIVTSLVLEMEHPN